MFLNWLTFFILLGGVFFNAYAAFKNKRTSYKIYSLHRNIAILLTILLIINALLPN